MTNGSFGEGAGGGATILLRGPPPRLRELFAPGLAGDAAGDGVADVDPCPWC